MILHITVFSDIFENKVLVPNMFKGHLVNTMLTWVGAEKTTELVFV